MPNLFLRRNMLLVALKARSEDRLLELVVVGSGRFQESMPLSVDGGQ